MKSQSISQITRKSSARQHQQWLTQVRMLITHHYFEFIIVLITMTHFQTWRWPVKSMYCVMVKIEESLPWIELKGEYATRIEARQAAQRVMQRIGMKIASIPDENRPMKALVTVRTKHWHRTGKGSIYSRNTNQQSYSRFLDVITLMEAWRRGRDSNPCEPKGPLAILSNAVQALLW